MQSSLYIGLMSGTSLDGIDAVVVDFSSPRPHLLAQQHTPFASALRERILTLCSPGEDEIERLGQLDIALAEQYARAVQQLLEQAKLAPSDIAAIGSHGQTIRHRPDQHPAFTLQVGDPNTLAERSGITTIADFRRRDMAAGGQGAPLVPAFHQAVFSHPQQARAVINIGGFANISILPPANQDQPVRGYDTGPGNVLLDAWIQQHLNTPYDAGGQWAASGTVVPALLQRLLQDPFFSLPAPKSTGREHFNLNWLQSRLAGYEQCTAPDIQATLAELTAHTVSQAVIHEIGHGEIFICGGGAHNRHLMQRLSDHLPQCRVKTTEALGLAVDWVEATAFAWLARQTWLGQVGNAHHVTGAQGPRILGGIYPA